MFALAEAAMRGCVLRVVVAVQPPDYGLAAPTMVALPSPQDLVDDIRKSIQSQVDDVVASHGQGAAAAPIEVVATVGHPAAVLCDAAEGAELLVVGHRGRGAVASAIIGSVGLHCALYAGCPVVIMRPDSSDTST